MKILFILKLSMLSSGIFSDTNSLYNINFTSIDGTQISMSSFAGKKLLVLILPSDSSQQSTDYLTAIDSFSRAFSGSFVFIGVPSYEDGYDDGLSQSLQAYYRGILGQQVYISQGMYTKIASKPNQSQLFSWLSDPDQNMYFNQDARGVGQKYFINEQGELYGVFGSEMTLHGTLIQHMFQ